MLSAPSPAGPSPNGRQSYQTQGNQTKGKTSRGGRESASQLKPLWFWHPRKVFSEAAHCRLWGLSFVPSRFPLCGLPPCFRRVGLTNCPPPPTAVSLIQPNRAPACTPRGHGGRDAAPPWQDTAVRWQPGPPAALRRGGAPRAPPTIPHANTFPHTVPLQHPHTELDGRTNGSEPSPQKIISKTTPRYPLLRLQCADS